MALACLLWAFLSIVLCTHATVTMSGQVPVVYIYLGELPLYLLLVIEYTLRYNKVVLITDDNRSSVMSKKHENLLVLSTSSEPDLMTSARSFGSVYKHMARDTSRRRQHYELANFQRWFVLSAYMEKYGIERALLADCDALIFGNMTRAFDNRPQCDTVLNIEGQTNFMWTAAGESSLWYRNSLAQFTQFTYLMYITEESKRALQLKFMKKPNVCDMTLLWLWWVTNKDLPSSNSNTWFTGRPAYSCYPQRSDEAIRKESDDAFRFCKTQLKLPTLDQVRAFSIPKHTGGDSGGPVHAIASNRPPHGQRAGWKGLSASAGNMNTRPPQKNGPTMNSRRLEDGAGNETSATGIDVPASTNVGKHHNVAMGRGPGGAFSMCNGLDVYKRTVFDHQHGWNDGGEVFYFVGSGDASLECPNCPWVIGDVSYLGGVPESMVESERDQLKHQPLYMLSLHYQGDSKRLIPYDVCRLLYFTGNNGNSTPTLVYEQVERECRQQLMVPGGTAMATRMDQLPCKEHILDRERKRKRCF
jgi:hypothetical protein